LTLVPDTNVLAELFLPARQSTRVIWWWERDRDWRLPPLWQSEFRHVLLKYIRADLLETTKALAIWQKAYERLAPLEHAVDGQEVLALAIRHQCSSYDAEFVVLAQQLGCPLLTFDRKLLQLFPDLAVQPGT
jgi:predicted nucleic acid-binding protein